MNAHPCHNVRPLVIHADKPQPAEWHARVSAAVESVPNDEHGSADSEALLEALEPLQIRGSADGYEFNGYDYAAQTWLDFTYAASGGAA